MRIDKSIFGSTPAALSVSSPNDHPAYRPDIDGLRAIAVLAVLVFHAFPSYLSGGFVGVDVFFVISGFLISSIICKGLQNGTFSFATFYARRIKRIFPALILVMAATLAFGWLALFPDEFKQLGKHIGGGAAFVANWFFWTEVGYFDTAAETKPLLHLWSLGIEEQFYIVWPVLLLLAWRLRLRLMAATAVLAALSFVANAWLVTHHSAATFYLPGTRAWELWLGALLAISTLQAPTDPAARPRVSPNLLSAGGLALVVMAMVCITRERAFPGWLALLPTVGTVMLIGAGPQAWVNRVLLSNRLLVSIGLISYPLYLWHWPLLSFAHIIESGTPSMTIRATAVSLALLLAWLTYVLVERPLRHVTSGKTRTVTLCVLMTLLAVAGGYIYKRHGLPNRASVVDSRQNEKALILVEDVDNAAACKKRYGFDSIYEYCQLAQIDKAPTVVLIGDSHAYHVMAGVSRHYSAMGDNLLFLGTRQPYWGLPPGSDGYQQATQAMLELALNTPSVHTVVFSHVIKVKNQSPEGKAMLSAMRDTYRRFTAAGKHLILMHDVPWLDFQPRACIKRAGIPSSTSKWPCAMKREVFDQATAVNDAIIKELLSEFPMIEQFSPIASLCDQSYCWAIKDGKMLYRDKDHLSYDGDLLVGERFAAERRAAAARTTK